LVNFRSLLLAARARPRRWLLLLALALGAVLVADPAARAGELRLAALGEAPDEAEMGRYSQLVRMIQVHLAERGLYSGPVGGVMTEETAAAIKAYQKIVGLPIDGRPSEALLEKLNSTQSAAKELLGKLDAARKSQIGAAREALIKEFGPDWARAPGSTGANGAAPVSAEACLARPEPPCLIGLALASAGRIEKDDLRDWALSNVVEAQVRAGQRAAALETARTITDPRSVIAAVGAIAVALARSGQTAEAVQAAERVPDKTVRDKALRAVAEGEASGGDPKAAAATAERIKAPAERLPALIAAARAYVAAQDAAAAAAVRDKAAGDLSRLKAGSLRDFATGLLARLDAELGRIDDAKALALEIKDRTDRGLALAEIAIIEARAGRSAAANETLAKAENGLACPIHRPECQHAHARLATATAELGRHAEAMAVVDALKPGFTRAFAHAGVAVATARAGSADAAEKIAGMIEDARARLDALIGIAEVLGAQGAQAEALAIGAAAAELARTLDNPVERAFSLIDLAQLAGRTGDAARAAALLKEATAIARGVDDPFGRTRSLSRIAVALATLGSD
jgi:peptidoglycan hydrolase-like protein with peptidoglycan-binding domain